jgi:hypothetical protein
MRSRVGCRLREEREPPPPPLLRSGERRSRVRSRGLVAYSPSFRARSLSSRMRHLVVEFSEQPPLSWAC